MNSLILVSFLKRTDALTGYVEKSGGDAIPVDREPHLSAVVEGLHPLVNGVGLAVVEGEGFIHGCTPVWG